MRWLTILVLVVVVATLVTDDPKHALNTLLREARTVVDRW